MNRDIYINGAAALSIQNSISGFFPDDFVHYRQRFVQAKEPDYKEFIPPLMARRMSRIIKRAIVVSQLALQDGGVDMPDAIIFGTGLGCIEDTEKFLNAVLDQNEQFLQPSFFIQSTHNTIASQVAMRLGCHGYNNTLVQRGLSFESALLDSCLLLEEGGVETVLTGGHDELTPTYFSLLDKAGYYSYNDVLGIGDFAGEGSISFVLGTNRTENSYAVIQALETFYLAQKDASFGSVVWPFLQKQGVAPAEVGAIFTACTEDEMGKTVYKDLSNSLFAGIPHIPFKAWCGAFFTASAFGLWLSAHYLRSGYLPEIRQKPYILVHNHSFNKHHSVILLKKVNR